MTEEQKERELAHLAMLATLAEKHGLKATAKSWRETYANVSGRDAEEMVITEGKKSCPSFG